jgi:four helix bundle protein
MQISNIKMQNEKDKFKKQFIKRLINFSVRSVQFADKIRKNRSYWSIADQLVRSVTSVGANVVEAKSSSSKREYIKYFEIALKSANEAKYWYLVIIEIVSSTKLKNEATILLKEADEISKIIGSSVLTLKGKRKAF